MVVQIESKMMERPATTWKNDSQRRGKPRMGRSAIIKPSVTMILFLGIFYLLLLILYTLFNISTSLPLERRSSIFFFSMLFSTETPLNQAPSFYIFLLGPAKFL